MAGLLDNIFENLAITQLDRAEVLSYTSYISEIYKQNLSLDQKVRYQRVKVRLNSRLIDLDTSKLNAVLHSLGKSSPLF